MIFKEIVDEVDFAPLLFGSGEAFQDGTDADGIVSRPAGRVHHLLGCLIPSGVGRAVRVGVGEDHHLVMAERPELAGLHLAESSGGKPDVLGIVLAEDDGRLLGFHESHLSARLQQMQAEEGVDGLEGFGWEAVLLLEEVADPCGVAILQTVTVGAIPHQLAVVDDAQLVDLPIDDRIVLRTAQAIAQCGMDHLAPG